MKTPRPLHAGLATLCAATALSLLASSATSHADLLYWAGGTGNAATAGTGNWDNVSINWDSDNNNTADRAFNSNTPDDASFKGTGGGTVTTTDTITVGNASFITGAGNFTILNNNLMEVTNGVTNSSNKTQTISNGGAGILTFSGGTVAVAGAGSVTNLSNSGIVSVVNSAGTGSAQITNNSGGTVYYNDNSTASNTSISTAGQVDLSGHIGALTLQSMVVTSGGELTLDNKVLNTTDLTLNNGNSLDFTLGSTSGRINVAPAGSFGGSGTNGSTVNFLAGPGFNGGMFTLIDYTEGTEAGVNAADFQVGTGIAGYTATFSVDNTNGEVDVNFTPVPEVSSFLVPLVGAAGLLGFRRRRSLPATQPVVA